jgi:Domain of unknown function (DUF4304)
MAELIDQLVVNELHPLLRPEGFARRGSTWNRRSGELIHVINIQSSQWTTRGNENCTVNLGVFWEKAYTVVWHKAPTRFVREYDCIHRKRIGQLLEDKLDRWWVLHSPDDVKEVGEILTHLLKSKGLPWLDGFASLRNLHDGIAAEEFGRNIPLAIVKAELGDRQGATALLDEGKGQLWQEHAESVREALGLVGAA